MRPNQALIAAVSSLALGVLSLPRRKRVPGPPPPADNRPNNATSRAATATTAAPTPGVNRGRVRTGTGSGSTAQTPALFESVRADANGTQNQSPNGQYTDDQYPTANTRTAMGIRTAQCRGVLSHRRFVNPPPPASSDNTAQTTPPDNSAPASGDSPLASPPPAPPAAEIRAGPQPAECPRR